MYRYMTAVIFLQFSTYLIVPVIPVKGDCSRSFTCRLLLLNFSINQPEEIFVCLVQCLLLRFPYMIGSIIKFFLHGQIY